MRTVHVTATVKLILKVDEGADLKEIIEGLTVTDPHNGGSNYDLHDARIENPEVTDSR